MDINGLELGLSSGKYFAALREKFLIMLDNWCIFSIHLAQRIEAPLLAYL